jgi:DNA anti-recombination protein RmuC
LQASQAHIGVLPIFLDDATVVLRVRNSHHDPAMAKKSLEERVGALEAQLGNKTLEQHFREQAELIDRRFAESFREEAELIDRLFVYRFDEFDKKWDVKLDARFRIFEKKLDSQLEEKFDAKLRPINEILKVILARLP